MSETETTEAQSQQVRAFWPSDYGRFARIVKDVRRREGDAAADALSAVVTPVLSADSDQFDQAVFDASTRDVPPQYGELARALKRARHTRGSYTLKPAEQLAIVDALTVALAGHFGTVDPRFDADKFATSTEIPALAAPDADPDEQTEFYGGGADE